MLANAELEMVRDTVRAYVADHVKPNAAAWDRDSTFPAQALSP